MMLCENCSRFGVEVRQSKPRRVVRPTGSPSRPTPRFSPGEEYDLAPDVHDRIRRARESMGWKREELAKKINEKLSIIEKLEKGNIRPDDQLVSKLEKALRVKLRERIEQAQPAKKEESRPLTLGDLIKRES